MSHGQGSGGSPPTGSPWANLPGANLGGADLGTLGRSTVLQYWNDMASAWMASGQEAGLGWLAIWQDLMLGRASPDRYVDLWRHWMSGWMNLALLPQQWWYQRVQSLPSLVFIMDGHTEASQRDQSAPVPVDLAGAVLESTDLHPVGGPAVSRGAEAISRSSVRAQATDDNRRLSVSLVGLGAEPGVEKVRERGVYAGVIYSREETVRRPVALVFVFIEPPTHAGF